MHNRHNEPPDPPITGILRQFAKGEPGAADELMRTIGAELHKIASQHMRKERGNHTLQTTALMNEAYVRLASGKNAEWNNRSHFLAVASRVMRQVLIDYARVRSASRRKHETVVIEAAALAVGPLQPDVLDVDAALTELARIAPRQAQLVELRFFGGLSLEEAADVLQVSPRTADKDWVLSRAWLRRKLGAR